MKGVPIKKLARDLRVSKNTIRKVVRGDATSHTYERKIQPLPKLGPWVEALERLLEENEQKKRRDRLSLVQLYEDLADEGYEGGYDAVRRYAKAWRRRRRLSASSQAYVPLIFDPGEAHQFDWSHEYARLAGATTRVKAAQMRLCYSRMRLVQIFPREGQEMVFIVRSARVDARRPRALLPLLWRVLPAGHLRQHEDGRDHGLCQQEAGLQPPLPADVLAPSGRAVARPRARSARWRARRGRAGRRVRWRGRWTMSAAACSCLSRGAAPTTSRNRLIEQDPGRREHRRGRESCGVQKRLEHGSVPSASVTSPEGQHPCN